MAKDKPKQPLMAETTATPFAPATETGSFSNQPVVKAPETKVPESKAPKPTEISPEVTAELQQGFMRDTAVETVIARSLRTKPVKYVDVCYSTSPETMQSHLELVVEGGIKIRIEGHFTVIPAEE